MKLDQKVRERYPEFAAGYAIVSGVTIEQAVEGLIERKEKVFSELKSKYASAEPSSIPEVLAYRNFFKQMGADPSSYRPAPEYLLRRMLEDRFPAINNLVDSCLLATLENWIPVGVYDMEKVKGDPVTTLSAGGESFQLISGKNVTTKANEIVLRDGQKLMAAYTLGDAKATMVTIKTSNALIVAWNAPGVDGQRLSSALNAAATYARRYCGGHVEKIEVL
ncbi:MAG: phenylalanine--tRNA ligase beta subunit-related protein [Candidatus Hadarchaeales archaeon]